MKDDDYCVARRHMVEEQIAARGVLDPHVLSAMGSVPRHHFIPIDDLAWAYADGPIPIGHGQTISQPYIVALMSEMLHLKSMDRVLEVGTGSGYQAAVLGMLAAEVHTVEMIPELATGAARLLKELSYNNIQVHTGDGSLGWPEEAPFDGILVAAAAPSTPQPLLDQLADGGRLVIPVGERGYQQMQIWVRSGQVFNYQENLAVAFVPLRGTYGWK
jgi:protein-L-isoaspartate(D-aspartate) O-methyltransferase